MSGVPCRSVGRGHCAMVPFQVQNFLKFERKISKKCQLAPLQQFWFSAEQFYPLLRKISAYTTDGGHVNNVYAFRTK